MAALELIAISPETLAGPSAEIIAPPEPAGRFAPLFTAGTDPYALAALDEFGSPLAGVYVPEALLL